LTSRSCAAPFSTVCGPARGLASRCATAPLGDDIDRLADHLEAHLDGPLLESIVGLESR